MNLVLIGIFLYILLQLLIGFIVSKRIRTEDDYLLAGRKLGYGLATFSIFATWFGAESCVGTAGAAYEKGLAGVTADPFGYTICLLLMGLFFAIPLWRMKLTTIADLLKLRFSSGAERITALIIAPTSLLWAAAQIRAFGLVLSASSQLTVTIAITISAVVVIAYTVSGGLLADAMTDIVQGIAVIVGLIILLPPIIKDLGGVGPAFSSIPSEKLAFVSVEAHSNPFGFLQIAEEWSIPILGSVIAQELISRVIATRTPVIARRSSLIAASMYFCIGLIPLFIGLVGSKVVPGLVHPEQVLPMMAQRHLSTVLYILFAGALVSAILSTVDSALLASSAMISHNLIVSFQPTMEERKKLFLGRLGVVAMGIMAYLLALHAEGIYNLVKDASAFGGAGIFIVVAFGLFTRHGGAKSAIASLLIGAVSWGLAHYAFGFEFSFLLSLVCSTVSYIFVGFLERRPVSAPAVDFQK